MADSFTSPARSSDLVENFHSFAMLLFLPAMLEKNHLLGWICNAIWFTGNMLLFSFFLTLSWTRFILTFRRKQRCPNTHIPSPCSGSYRFCHCRCTLAKKSYITKSQTFTHTGQVGGMVVNSYFYLYLWTCLCIWSPSRGRVRVGNGSELAPPGNVHGCSQ